MLRWAVIGRVVSLLALSLVLLVLLALLVVLLLLLLLLLVVSLLLVLVLLVLLLPSAPFRIQCKLRVLRRRQVDPYCFVERWCVESWFVGQANLEEVGEC